MLPLRNVVVGVFALLMLLGACATDHSQGATDSPPPPARPRTAIIALDGVEPALLDSLLQTGDLPHLERLIERGSRATIHPVTELISPVVWTTVATGVSPDRHGILGFTDDGVPVTSTMRKAPAFWNILPRFGIKPAVLGWIVTWPAETGDGIIISDRAYWGEFDHKIEPPGIIDLTGFHYNGIPNLAVLPRFTSYPYDAEFEALPEGDPRYAVNFLLKRRLLDIYVHDSTYYRMAIDILAENDVDLLAAYFRGVDYVSHGFWQYFEPEPFRQAGWKVPEEDVRLLGDIIPKYYVYLDRLIGNLVQRLDENAFIIVLSDHGFGPGLGEYEIGGDFLSGNHRPESVLILSGPQIADGIEQAGRITHLDILPTVLFALDLPMARDLEGHPLLQYFESSFLAERQLSVVDRYPFRGRPEDEVKGSEEDEQILKELRSLGYLD